MSDWKAKRSWDNACVIESSDGFGIAKDGKTHTTPLGRALEVPSRDLADLIAVELNGVQCEIDWHALPLTVLGTKAVDMTADSRKAVVDELAEYGGSDLLCYRAIESDALAARQSAAWDPLLEWMETTFGVKLIHGEGVMPIKQSEGSLRRLRAQLSSMGPFNLTALSALTRLAGSVVIGLGAIRRFASAGELWGRSQVDENWQREMWGSTPSDREDAARREEAFSSAFTFSFAAGCSSDPAL